MEVVKKKSFWIVLIIVCAAVILLGRIITPREWSSSDATLTITNDSIIPIGSITLDYSKLDGSLVTEGTVNADGSLILKGDIVSFFQVNWPVIVSLYSDVQARDLLMKFVIEEGPDDNCRWAATIFSAEQELAYRLESVPLD